MALLAAAMIVAAPNAEKAPDGAAENKDFGVAWARHWGEGRVFYCTLGHNHHIYWHPTVLRHYLAGIQWAIGDREAKFASANDPAETND